MRDLRWPRAWLRGNIILIFSRKHRFEHERLHKSAFDRVMGDNGKSQSLLHSRKAPKVQGYSTFDPGGSIDSGLSFSTDERGSRANGIPSSTTAIERQRVSISWENIDVFVELPGPSFFKRMCFGTEENERPRTKQVLFNGKYISSEMLWSHLRNGK